MARQIAKTYRALLIHGQDKAIHPEQVQRQVAADLIAVFITAGLHPAHNVSLGGSLFAEIPPDDCHESLEAVKDREIQLGEKIAWEHQPAIAIQYERFEQHTISAFRPHLAAIRLRARPH